MRKPDRGSSGPPEIEAEATSVLRRIEEQRRARRQAEAAELEALVSWADLHRAESPVNRSHPGPYGTEGVLFLAGAGARGLAEFAVCQVAASLGLSERATRTYLGEALELRDRLPRLYARAVAGDLPVWRARQIAEQTRPLRPATAAYVDAHLAGFAHKISAARIRRCVEAAVSRCEPEEGRARAEAAADARGVSFDDHLEGVTTLRALLSTPDAASLEHRIAVVAQWLAVLGDTDSLDVRRAKALGLLGDPQAVLDFEARVDEHLQAVTGDDSAAGESAPPRPSRRAVPVEGAGRFGTVVHIHLHTTSEGAVGPVARIDAPRRHHPVPLAAVETWLRDLAPGALVKLTGVVDVGDSVSVDAYEVPTRIADQVDQRDLGCQFPWCGNRGRFDRDHVIEYVPLAEGGPPGQTNASNLARLCRFHHRVKTHTAWHYARDPDGSLRWESPLGQQFRVDHTGTTRIS